MKKQLLIFSAVVLLFGCSSGMKNNINQEASSLIEMSDSQEMNKKLKNLIHNSKELNRDQKNKLLRVQNELLRDLEQIDTMTTKLQFIWLKSFSEKRFNLDKTKEVKRQMITLFNSKLRMIQNAEKRAKEIHGSESNINSLDRDFNNRMHGLF